MDYFAGLSGRKLRYVPFNGGIGEQQIKWLRKEVLAEWAHLLAEWAHLARSRDSKPQ